MFSLHKMIAYMFQHIMVTFEEVVNFENGIMGVFLRNKIYYSYFLLACILWSLYVSLRLEHGGLGVKRDALFKEI